MPHKNKHFLKKRLKGFTITELLIVMLVIGVIAAIILIGYRQVTSQAYDAAVKNDLRNIRDKLDYYHSMNGTYPSDNAAELGSRGMAINTDAFDTTTPFNLAYCYNFSTNDYLVTGMSRSGNMYAIGSSYGLTPVDKTATRTGLSSNPDCSDVSDGFSRLYSGYDKYNAYNGVVPGDSAPWREWITSPAVIGS